MEVRTAGRAVCASMATSTVMTCVSGSRTASQRSANVNTGSVNRSDDARLSPKCRSIRSLLQRFFSSCSHAASRARARMFARISATRSLVAACCTATTHSATNADTSTAFHHANAPNETGGANAPSSARAVEPKVREDLLAELTEIMGFNRNKAVRALYFSQADSAERAIDWIERHEEDADVNEPLLIEDESSAAKGVKTVSKMTAEEAKAKADELRRNAAAKKAERLLEEREMERLREQERIRSGKELVEAKKLEDELSLKRNIEQRRAEKEEMDRARAAIRVKIDEDRRERRRKLGLPEEMTPEELEEERKREEAKENEPRKE